ncbi:MAG: hypothetical protein CHACPFDD_01689 [Phycisphaerae bacterium]|nr:hypothetical protein [Phycisphaerae bacterium]
MQSTRLPQAFSLQELPASQSSQPARRGPAMPAADRPSGSPAHPHARVANHPLAVGSGLGRLGQRLDLPARLMVHLVRSRTGARPPSVAACSGSPEPDRHGKLARTVQLATDADGAALDTAGWRRVRLIARGASTSANSATLRKIAVPIEPFVTPAVHPHLTPHPSRRPISVMTVVNPTRVTAMATTAAVGRHSRTTHSPSTTSKYGSMDAAAMSALESVTPARTSKCWTPSSEVVINFVTPANTKKKATATSAALRQEAPLRRVTRAAFDDGGVSRPARRGLDLRKLLPRGARWLY